MKILPGLTLLFLILFLSPVTGENGCINTIDTLHVQIIDFDVPSATIEIKISVIDCNGDTLPAPRLDPSLSNMGSLTPTPYFMYFVEFGDGEYVYTQENTIQHTYLGRAYGQIVVKVNYIYGDDGEPPSFHHQLPDDLNNDLLPFSYFFSNLPAESSRNIEDSIPEVNFIFDDEPTIGRKMTACINYRNIVPKGNPISGFIHFYYNEALYAPDGFTVHGDSSRTYKLEFSGQNQLPEVSDLFIEARDIDENEPNEHGFNKVAVWQFNDLHSEEIRTLCFEIDCNSSLGADPSRNLMFEVKMLIDGNPVIITTNDEFPILMARDPNKMSVYESVINPEDQYINYRVQFQNIGKAPVTDVTINLELAPWLEISDTVNIVYSSAGGGSPSCSLLPLENKDSIVILLQGVHLPGLGQVMFPPPLENTIGCIEFKVFHKADLYLDQYKMQSQAQIRFGILNEVITTNTAVTNVVETSPSNWRFSLRSGINYPFPYRTNTGTAINPIVFRNVLLGVVSEKKPKKRWKTYLRGELTLNSLGYKDNSDVKLDLLYLELALQARLIVARKISIGAGASLSQLLNARTVSEGENYSLLKLGIMADAQYKINRNIGFGARIYSYYSNKLFDYSAAFFPVGQIYFEYKL